MIHIIKELPVQLSIDSQKITKTEKAKLVGKELAIKAKEAAKLAVIKEREAKKIAVEKAKLATQKERERSKKKKEKIILLYNL